MVLISLRAAGALGSARGSGDADTTRKAGLNIVVGAEKTVTEETSDGLHPTSVSSSFEIYGPRFFRVSERHPNLFISMASLAWLHMKIIFRLVE